MKYQSPFLNDLHDFMLARRYSKRTIRTYITWIRSYIHFNDKRHPSELGNADVERFLTHLAVNRTVSASTQTLALNALAFLYNKYLEKPLGKLDAFKQSRRPAKLPTVLTQDEIGRLLAHVPAQYKLLVGILYGSGLRRMELVRLRVNDVDTDLKQIKVWNGKGFKHRLTTLAPELIPAIARQKQHAQLLLEEDLLNPDYAGVWLPDALAGLPTTKPQSLKSVQYLLKPQS